MTDEERNAGRDDFRALLEFLKDTPNKLANLTDGLADDEIRLKNSAAEFSALENICHLRDLELLGYTERIRRILAEADPALADFDGARVAAESSYDTEQPGVVLQAFQNARIENIKLLQALTGVELERQGTLAGVGKITLKLLAKLMREHDEGHLEDLRTLRQRIERCRELTQ